MKSWPGELPGIWHFQPQRHGDQRGWFMESWRDRPYADAGIRAAFVQDNLARSARGVLRGMHIQHPRGQGKLVQVLEGRVFDVAVDLRRGSPTFGRWEGVTLDGAEPHQFYVPAGFAHGYLVLSDSALFGYKCTDYYHPENEFSLRWNDPAVGIDWPLAGAPLLSEKDRHAPALADLAAHQLPPFEE